MSPRTRRLVQGGGAACFLLAGGLIALPLLGFGPGGTDSTGSVRSANSTKTVSGPPPILGKSPSFELTDQDGEAFASDGLRGSVWVADFVFTRCVLVCPILSRSMARLQAAAAGAGVADQVHLVSISVDPEHDTPEVLSAYAARHDAEPGRWSFLTGERDAVWWLIRDGFGLLVTPTPQDEINPIVHSPRLLLHDREGRLRGRYDGTVPEEVEQLERDLLWLAGER